MVRLRPLLVLATCAATIPALAHTAAAKPKVAILGIEVTGGGATDEKTIDAAKQLTKELRREANRPSGNFDVAPDSQKDLLEIKMLSDCSDEGRRCMSEIGQDLGAQRLIYGKLERKKGHYEVSLKLLNTETRELEEQLSESIPFDEMSSNAALSSHARSIYARLSGAPVEAGLSITANAERGTIYVDGKIKTTLSAGSAHIALSPGEHTIAIEADGYAKYETEVTAEAGATSTLRAQLVELEGGGGDDGDGAGGRPGSGWRMAFWTGVVVTGAAGAAWTYSGFKVLSAEDDLNAASSDENTVMPAGAELDSSGDYVDACRDFKGTSGPGASDVLDACDTGRKHRNLVNYVFMPTTIAGALFSAFAFYKGYVSPRKAGGSERDARRRTRRRDPIVVAPAVGPDLLGAGLEITF